MNQQAIQKEQLFNTKSLQKMYDPKWCLFYDNHTMPTCPDVGMGFDVEAFTDQIKECGVDFIAFHARCNMGMAYYDTEIGIKHPSLKYDLFGKLTEACSRKGIALGAYFNGGLSHEEARVHREWCKIFPDGTVYRREVDGGWINPSFRMMCCNTGYGDHLVKMVEEVASKYDVTSLFVDCFDPLKCICPDCVAEMKEKGIDWKNEKELYEFARFTNIRAARKIVDAFNAIRPNRLIYVNGLGIENQMDFGTYVECECLPTRDWGYDYLPIQAHYLRTLGKPVLNMTGRFHEGWGDFGGIRTKASLEYDCIYGLANGMRPNIGGHFHPRGDLDLPVFELIKEIYHELQKLEPWYSKAVPLVDFAVVSPDPKGEKNGCHLCDELKGACRVFSELKAQFDVITLVADWDQYDLLILPDEVIIEGEILARIEKHLKAGKKIISSYHSGLDLEKKNFVFSECGLEYAGESPYDPAYISVSEDFSENFPQMPITLYEKGSVVKLLDNTKSVAEIVAPYYNREFDGEYGFCYTPPDKPAGQTALSMNSQVAHFSHPFFRTYAKHAQVPMRQLLSNVMDKILPEPLLKTSGMPSFGRATVTSQSNRRMVHLMAYVPEKRGDIQMIEERIFVQDVSLSLRLDGRVPTKVYIAQDSQELSFKINGAYIDVDSFCFEGYALLVFE